MMDPNNTEGQGKLPALIENLKKQREEDAVKYAHLTTDFYFSPHTKQKMFFIKKPKETLMDGFFKDTAARKLALAYSSFVKEGYVKAGKTERMESIVRVNDQIIAICGSFAIANSLVLELQGEDFLEPHYFLKHQLISYSISCEDWGKIISYNSIYDKEGNYVSSNVVEPEFYRKDRLSSYLIGAPKVENTTHAMNRFEDDGGVVHDDKRYSETGFNLFGCGDCY